LVFASNQCCNPCGLITYHFLYSLSFLTNARKKAQRILYHSISIFVFPQKFYAVPLVQADRKPTGEAGQAERKRTDGKAARCGGGFPFGRITANGGEARGSAHGGYGVA
jgi:hypothetical protein